MARKKKILFVINTMGRGGAEAALLELLRRFEPERFEVSLFVLLNQGELIERLPPHVRLLNRRYDPSDVLSAAGKRRLYARLSAQLMARGALLRNLPYLTGNFMAMLRAGSVRAEKLLWRAAAEGAQAIPERFDLAVAFLEGGATYYVSRRVRAARKAAFLHVDYGRAGYTRELDLDDYAAFDRIFCVSQAVRSSFLRVYPEYAAKSEVFHNLHDRAAILRRAEEPGGFTDAYEGPRIVTLGRLVSQKAPELSIEAMALLRRQGVDARWYLFGEGGERPRLEQMIRRLGLADCFFLPGAVENPYKYLKQAEVYVHCTRYEGFPIAVQEALMLGRAVVCADTEAMREMVSDGVNGVLTELDPHAIAKAVRRVLTQDALRHSLEERAPGSVCDREDTNRLLALLSGPAG